MQRLAAVLDGEVDDRGRAAVGRGDGPRLEVVGRRRSPERHVEVGVDVDAAGQHQLAGRVDDPIGREVERGTDHRDALTVDEDVADVQIRRGHDCPALDENAHGRSPS